jgi:hypothetical protein
MQTEQEKLKDWEKEFDDRFKYSIHPDNAKDFIRGLLSSQKQKMGEMISTIDTKAHACIFNDGEQSKNPYCDCYLEALSDIKQRIDEL